MPPSRAAIQGRAAFQAWVQPFFDGFRYDFAVVPSACEVTGGRAREQGSFTTTLTPLSGGPPARHSGEYIVQWRREADRFLATPDGGRLEAAPGEATVWGARSTYWFRPQLAFQADLSHSHNESWFGGTSAPPPDFVNTTTYLSARAVARTAPARGVQLFVGAGPALMLHGGTGTSYRGRDTDVGAVIEAGARLRLAGRLSFQLAIGNYLYVSRYTQASPSTEPVAQPVPPGNDFKHDVLVLPGLVWSWR